MFNPGRNIFLPVIALAVLPFILKHTEAENSLFDCSAKYKCSDKKEYVWATDEERCHVFHNKCLFRVEQCGRRSQGKSELIETDKETCKQTCEQACNRIFEPVCAQFFQEEYITFANECEMRNYMCTQETAYSFYAMEECFEFP